MIEAPKLHTDLLWDLSCLFIILASLYFIAVFYFRNKINTKSKKVAIQKKALSPMISEFLFMEDDATKNEKTNYVNLKIEIRQLLKDDFNRRVLTEILLDLRKDVSGDTQIRLFKLYTDLGLHNDAYEKLRSWRWEVISKGISELTQMKVEDSFSFITKFINDKRGTIRKQAEIATVTLKHEGINYFLDTTTFKISEWQQLKLLDVLRNFEDYQPPPFKAWLTSKNTHTVLFALRLIKYYSQNDAYASIIELVKHQNNQIKQEAITCIKEFNIVNALKVLKIVFWKSTVAIKISILDTISSIGNESDIQFLRSIESKERSFSVRSKAVSAINAIAPESILPTKGIEDISQYTIPDDIPTAEAATPPSVPNKEESVPMKSNSPKDDTGLVPDAKKLQAIQVVFEEVLPKAVSIPREEEKSEQEENNLEPITTTDINLGFLPIVVDDSMAETETEALPDGCDSIENIQDILDLPVVFQRILPTVERSRKSLDLNDQCEKPSYDDPELNFLPWVVEKADPIASEVINGDQDDQPYRFKIDSQGKTKSHEPKDLPVVFEAISPTKNQHPPSGVKLPEIKKGQSNEILPSIPPQSIKEIDPQNIRGIDVYYEILATETPKVDENDITRPLDNNGLDAEAHTTTSEMEKPKAPIDTENELFEDSLHLLVKPQFYDADTLAMVQLLDDVEELGDEREIPLLLSYLEKETNPEIKERIRHLVKKFAHWEPYAQNNDTLLSKEALFQAHSLIKELFDNSDEEAQIILLDSLIDVMDEKELDFLEGLNNHPNGHIRQKSKIALSALNKRLESESTNNEAMITDIMDKSYDREPFDFGNIAVGENNEIKENPEESHDIFKVDFELAPLFDPVAENEIATITNTNSLLDQFRSISNRLIKKLHG